MWNKDCNSPPSCFFLFLWETWFKPDEHHQLSKACFSHYNLTFKGPWRWLSCHFPCRKMTVIGLVLKIKASDAFLNFVSLCTACHGWMLFSWLSCLSFYFHLLFIIRSSSFVFLCLSVLMWQNFLVLCFLWLCLAPLWSMSQPEPHVRCVFHHGFDQSVLDCGEDGDLRSYVQEGFSSCFIMIHKFRRPLFYSSPPPTFQK